MTSYLPSHKLAGVKHSLGSAVIVDQASASAVAEGGDRCARRQRVLLLAHAQVVRSLRVGYLTGLAKNAPVLEQAEVQQRYRATQQKQRLFADIHYAADSGDGEHLVIVKARHSAHGSNPGFVVTHLKSRAQYECEELYCASGEMKHRI